MSHDEVTEKEIKEQVVTEIEDAKEFARTIDFEQVRSGDWFFELLRQVVKSYQKNARAEYFQQKYPGLTPDEIADILTSVTVRYAAIAGAITGVAVSASQIATLGSAGMTAALFVTSIGAEMVYLARLQLRLILDLATIYDLQLDPDDPEDILMIFGYAIGVTPTEMLGKGLQIAAGATTKAAIRTYISKGTLKAIQDFARSLGFKILQRTIIKYAVPAASAAVGGGYNYFTTSAVGRIAKSHFRNRGKVTEELRLLVSRQHTYDLVFPAAIMYVAQVDGEYDKREQEFYKALLSRMSFDEHTQAQFQNLITNEERLLETIAEFSDSAVAETLFELLVLMTVYDGNLAEEERSFLTKVAQALQIDIDLNAVEARAEEFRVNYTDGRWHRIAEATGNSLGTARETTSQFLQSST